MSVPCHAPKASRSPGMAWLQLDSEGLMFWTLQAPVVSGQPQAACDDPRCVATSFLPAAAPFGFPENPGSGYCLKRVYGGTGGMA